MPKKIKFESFKYRFLIAAQNQKFLTAGNDRPTWPDFINKLIFKYEKGSVNISWDLMGLNSFSIPLNEAQFYFRGDNEKYVSRQKETGMLEQEDPVKLKNTEYFRQLVLRIAQSANYKEKLMSLTTGEERIAKEREFHDAWADSEDLDKIDIKKANGACTAPEMRYITKRLGDIRGKKLLDVGCGLGEASVYFALLGAEVTSLDLSQGMLEATCKLAKSNGVSVTPHVASAEDLQLPNDAKFDIIYSGNLLHHVEIDQTLERIKHHLTDDGVTVTWDPLAYNPVINVYRSMATDVRTPDEHPLKWGDIKLFKKHFGNVETKYYWLTTLIIFLIMALLQRRNPNKERFWKVVVQEGDKWQWLYGPLEKLDNILLWLMPPLRLICWNIVVISSKPKK